MPESRWSSICGLEETEDHSDGLRGSVGEH